MKNKTRLTSTNLFSVIALILSLVLFLSTASASSVQSAPAAITSVHIPNSDGTASVTGNENNNIKDMTMLVGDDPEAFRRFIVSPSAQAAALPVANFSTNVTNGYAPLPVQFIDKSQNATEWNWDFGDGTNSTEQNPLHNYSAAGNYTVNLTVSNMNGTASKFITINVLESRVFPLAEFNIGGYAPLPVQFTDNSQNATGWNWDFGDGTNSNEQNPLHNYSVAGNYTVNLTVSNANGTASRFIAINVLEPQIFPLAEFNIGGYAPLLVQFTDNSQNATGWNWDFGDGAGSTEQNPFHTYLAAGNYIVNLTISTVNGTASKTALITILQASHSSSVNIGGERSLEPQSNVADREISQIFITSGNPAKFDFPKKATPVVYLSFGSKKTIGKTIIIVETLIGKSTSVSELPSDEIYRFFNIWVRNSGFVDSNVIENAVVYFKVEKSWIKDKNMDQSSITLDRYNNSKWNKLSTNLSGEDDKYLYFTAQTLGFSPFAITGKIIATGTVQTVNDKTQNSNISGNESTKAPDFEVVCGITILFAIFLYKKK